MGLISEYVEVGLCPKTIKYYENLGYDIPRRKDNQGRITMPRNTKIKVKVKDLHKNSKVKVMIKCDYCNKKYEITYENYNRYKHDEKYYCTSCTSKLFNSRENNHLWNPNKTDEEREQDRKYPKYTDFVKKVLARDNYTCKCCGKYGESFEVHHLDGYDWCVDKRTDETNGVTLCKACHKNFHSIYGYGNNTRQQFEEWIGHAVELLKYENELPTAKKIYCFEEDRVYNSVKELADELNCAVQSIYFVCNHKTNKDGSYRKSVKGKHILWLYEYEYMSEREIKEWADKNKEHIKKENKNVKNKKSKKYRKVICVTTEKVFLSLSEGGRYYNCNYNHISGCCRGKEEYCGKLSDGTKLQWKYIDDLTEEEYIKYDIENKIKELNKQKGLII